MPIISLLKPEIKLWLEKSITSELYASNLYKHFANQLQYLGFFGAQKFYLSESEDELKHYQIIVDYANDMGDWLKVPMIPPPPDIILSIGDALRISYETEKKLLMQYQEFYEEAEGMGDCITAQFTLQFLEIQRKAVGEYGDLISRYEVAERTNEIILFDKELA